MLLKVFDEGSERVEEELSMEKLLKSTRNLVTLLKNKGLMKEQDEVELMFQENAVIDLNESEDDNDHVGKCESENEDGIKSEGGGLKNEV